jgi:hypothetical protein
LQKNFSKQYISFVDHLHQTTIEERLFTFFLPKFRNEIFQHKSYSPLLYSPPLSLLRLHPFRHPRPPFGKAHFGRQFGEFPDTIHVLGCGWQYDTWLELVEHAGDHGTPFLPRSASQVSKSDGFLI